MLLSLDQALVFRQLTWRVVNVLGVTEAPPVRSVYILFLKVIFFSNVKTHLWYYHSCKWLGENTNQHNCIYVYFVSNAVYFFLQECQHNFYRMGGVLFGGNCLLCECNDHANKCDNNGTCLVSFLIATGEIFDMQVSCQSCKCIDT